MAFDPRNSFFILTLQSWGIRMALKVLGAGFGRTGTNSLKLALEELGFGPCHHMMEVNEDAPDQVGYWEDIANGGPKDWDRVFEGFNAQLDWPGCRYWRELASYYPDAKVVLSVRDVDGWIKSFNATIAPYMAKRGQHDNAMRNRKAEMAYNVIAKQTFDGRYDDAAHLRNIYNAHIKMVQSTIPAHRLLTFDVRAGWAPLCAFLGVAVPETPFPRTNSSREFQEKTDVTA